MADIRIIYDGRLALTTAQAAARHGLAAASMRKEIQRLGLAPLPQSLDGRTPLYGAAELDRAMRQRPGKGRRS